MDSKFERKSIWNSTPIMCPSCHKESGLTQEGLMFYVITHYLTCKHCGAVVIHYNPVTF